MQLTTRYVRYICFFAILCLTTILYGCSVLNLSKQSVSLVRVLSINEGQFFANQVTRENTEYEVEGDFDLEGGIVAIPEGCTLIFKGGSVSNGTLLGNKTLIVREQDEPVFKDVMLKGTFRSSGEFSINAYSSNKLDYFYSFIQAFSGTPLYLSDDYSVTEYEGISDGAMPQSIEIDGRGHKLTLYSLGAYKVLQCKMKNITIECRNNITPRNNWKQDSFTFGIVGSFEKSSLELNNVTFTKECGFAYFRGFKKLEISQCKEDGSYFFIYDCNDVSFHHNIIVNAPMGYYSIGKMTEAGKVKIYNNQFNNINAGGIILTGGLKYNVDISNNVLDQVGSGGATNACINIHPRGTINVSNNMIVANKGAVTLDIDAAKEVFYSNETSVVVDNNIIENVAGDLSLHCLALVGLAQLYVRNNTIKDQVFYFWDTPYMEFCGNTMAYSKGFDKSISIGKMSTHKVTEQMVYQHIFKDNVFDIPYANSYVTFQYLSKAKVRIIGANNTYSKPVNFIDQYKRFEASGDIRIYK